ncbi:replication factor C subunit 1 isoform X1 [Cataglyphis hispanica]|uniref:replication factor C subunit 1 isoform X1 n=1 Tax=Cataglyphis hispanica TaxID=1086592 RepID=UPI0021800AF0|nr:replication factor C subunit 1 isoform X1 [Cataglyphis hispanica]
MPRDIRSYFVPVATSQKRNSESVSKPQKRRVISSDEDEERSKSSAKRNKIVRKKMTKVSILSDSDDDIIEKNNKNNFTKSEANKKNESEKPSETISFSELFGKRPIMRVEDEKVSQKLQKLESEFHNDDDFDAVLKQLDTSQDMIIEDTKGDKDGTKNANISQNSDEAFKTEIISNKSKKHTSLKDNQTNKTNMSETKEMKKSPNKNNIHSKMISLSSKEKLKMQRDNSSSNEDLDTKSKCSDDESKKLNFNNLAINISRSAAKENEEIKKQSPDRKKAKMLDLFEERIEKKKQRAAMYEKYLQRGGARNPGSKEIPIGAQNCLAGITFVLTGVLDSLERNEVEDLIRKYGGRTVNTVSGKVNYIIVGDEAGPSKLAKANNLGIKQISEDDLLEMICTRPEGKAEDVKLVTTKAKSNVKKILNTFEGDKSLTEKTKSTSTDLCDLSEKIKSPCSSVKTETSSLISKQTLDAINYSQETTTKLISSQPLVEKYRPKTMKQIIGQQGDKSCAHNLYVWLRDWNKNHQDPKFKNNNSKQTHGQSFKAALLSGPPGVGKTTTVQVVCKELGYDLIEFNASDTRNKMLLKDEVSGLLSNTTMKDYITGDTKQKITSKHVLLMDEVDGMAGNEDRGGLQELLNLIKNTQVPIICICNDRFNTRVKSISTHSYDLRFHKLRVEQIRSSMKSLCFKENIKISTEDLDRLIESTNYDIRQVINHLEFLGGRTPHVEATDRKHSNKNFKLGPFDVVKMAFNAEEQKKMNLNDKIDLYFHDYNIVPLFVEENYLSVRLSQMTLLQRLDKIARAADNISQGDLVEKMMRSNMMWSLLPLHACFSFVIPTSEMSGSLDTLVRFPSWFGRNSKTTRFNRLMQELTMHTRLATGASKDALNMDYLVHIRNAIIKPLIDNGVDGIEAAINIMGKYYLTREDLDSIIEISLWPGIRDSTSNLDSKVKAAFTRAYQKNPPMLPYTINSNVTSKKRSMQDENFIEEENDEEEDDSIESDKMIKAKKSTAASTSKGTVSTKRSSESAKKRGKGRDKSK